jgi:glucosamine-6-phosphate deaminase
VRDFLHARITRQGGARVILASGSSQLKFLDDLVRLGGIEWSRVTCFHMDEYLGLPANHSASFRRYMRERVEKRLRPKAFHYLQGDAAEPIKECERYERLLREKSIDLCCCGIGENGHLAFNDPSADFTTRRIIQVVTLAESCRQQQVGEGHFAQLEDVPRQAISLTVPALLAPQHILVIAPEARKAAAVRAALEEPITEDCPASILRTAAHARLYLDHDSAALLGTRS